MGDRANVVIKKEGRPDLYLYTHDGRHRLALDVQAGIARCGPGSQGAPRGRGSQASYLARSVLCEMMKGMGLDLDGTTGIGIATMLEDGDTPIILVVRPIISIVVIDGTFYPFEDFVELDVRAEFPELCQEK